MSFDKYPKKCWSWFFNFQCQKRNNSIFIMSLIFEFVKRDTFWTKNENSLFSKNHQKKTRYKSKILSPTNLQYDTLVDKFCNEKYGAGPLSLVICFEIDCFSKNCFFFESQYSEMERLIKNLVSTKNYFVILVYQIIHFGFLTLTNF